tara:strand:- start:19 stop:270 length:252 start_codon:yes stop_codon:yes gene_type:complete
MPVIQAVSEMIAAARLLIKQVGILEAAELQRLDAAILIDLRNVRELQKMGLSRGPFTRRAACWNSGPSRTAPITSSSSAPTKS